MPLGGSITYGIGSSDKNGYREVLHNMLTSHGYVVEMVGSRRSGTMPNNQNEGWRGFTIDQIRRQACRSIPVFLPNLVLLNAGSNDCLQDLELGYIGQRIGGMLEYIWETSPGSTILLSTLLPNLAKATEERVLQSNAQFEDVARQKEMQNKRLVLVDMHSAGGPDVGELVDGTHPNDAGYAKMAKKWYEGVEEAFLKGFIQGPATIPPCT
ncbi:SGNH hydrolase-type esterase domain-containing protein [Xylariales sp. PMI_506]|nr:SGNH hydrolase-type esterase domain-containing protein [Xylariales sp. PMI_506]